MSFLKAIWRGSSKHKKLCEEWALANSKEFETEPPDSVTFNIKYLGSALVETPSNEEATAEAIKTIITMAKASGKKLQRVALTVSLRGIKMVDLATEDVHLEVSIYRISYCSADATYDHVFAFIATNTNETMECHAFLCPKRKMAQAVTLTVAQSFNTAYEMWQVSQGPTKIHEENNRQQIEKEKITEGFCNKIAENCSNKIQTESKSLLIDFTSDPVKYADNGNSWVSFEDERTENFNSNFARFSDNTAISSNSPQQHIHLLQNNSHNTSNNSCWGETHSINLLCS